MSNFKNNLLYVILTFAFIFISGHSFAEGVNVRVAVGLDKPKVQLKIDGPYAITPVNSDKILEKGANLKNETVTPAVTGIKIGQKEFKAYGVRIIPQKDAAIFLDSTQLRGIVDIIRTQDMKLLLVNHIDIEKYLYGVLYHETPHYWPIETLKAQAVAARTFALYRKEIMKDKDYDVTSDIYSQVYGGKKSERRRTIKAVDSTRGQALIYNGNILPAYYHSICAGHTESAKIVFGVDAAPLKGVKCPYCRGAKGMEWKAMFSYKQMEKRFNDYGIKINGMKGIKEGSRDTSGRLETIVITDTGGTKEIKGFKFRLALDPNLIRSANFTIDVTPKGVIFKGVGWGHGVGMCQWGAFGMARAWKGYKDILRFYYPGAEIKDIEKIKF